MKLPRVLIKAIKQRSQLNNQKHTRDSTELKRDGEFGRTVPKNNRAVFFVSVDLGVIRRELLDLGVIRRELLDLGVIRRELLDL